MPNTVTPVEKPARQFLPESLSVDSWETIQQYFDALLEKPLNSKEDLKAWLKAESELSSVLSENLAWRYIRMTCDTANEEKQKDFEFFVSEIEPQVAPMAHQLNEKLLNSPFINELNDSAHEIMLRSVSKEFEIYREKNIPIFTELQKTSQKFGTISGAMTVEIDGKELTLPQAGALLEDPDRSKREEVYRKVAQRRMQDKGQLNEVFDSLIKMRDEVAHNADFANFRDYMFTALARFDFNKDDCFAFHESVAKSVVPLLNESAQRRKETLQLDSLRPWDKAVDTSGKPALKPFENGDDLLNKTVKCFNKLDTFFGDCLLIMNEMGHLDLESRKGKAPGGYNYPLAEVGVPFIFMNASSTVRDMVTLLHEGGHAIHSFLTKDLALGSFKNPPSEVAELASMSMELLTLDYWDIFFTNEEDLVRAKRQHLEQVIDTLPWVATIDKFQHWLYENPNHTRQGRTNAWLDILDTFSDKVTDWSGLEDYRASFWQKQLHLFEVPFYYIEYGFAQLGAVAVWKNYKENPQKALEDYKNALKLGYTKKVPEIYETAGIRFDFSEGYIKELMQFVKDELDKL